MGYDEDLDQRVTEETEIWSTTRKKMFGGTCHLLNGNMLCGVNNQNLIVRLGKEAGEKALLEPNTRPMNVTGKPMKGWVTVEPKGYEGNGLLTWLKQAHAFVSTLPPK